MDMNKRLFVMVAALLLLLGIARAEGAIASKAALNEPGRRIGVSQGSAAVEAVMSELPKAEIVYYTDNLLGYTAVAQGKIDAYVYDRVQMNLAIKNGLTGVRLLPEDMDRTVQIAVGCSDASGIPNLKDSLNRFIAAVKADGTLDDMYRRWVVEGNDVMPEIAPAENPKARLTVGTTGSVPPYSYYANGGLTGYDIELAHRFAAWLGASLSIEVYDFEGIVPAATAGKIDVIMSNLQYLPERSEGLPFSDILYEEKMGILVRGEDDAPSDGSSGLSDALLALNGKRVGVQTGTSFDEMVLEKLPEAHVDYFNGKADLLAALAGRKIDAFVVDEPVAQILMRESDQVTTLPGYLDSYEFAPVFPKSEAGERLRDQFNAFLGQLPGGTLERLAAKWFGEDEAAKTMPDVAGLSAENGTLRLATESGYAPFEYVRDGAVVGYDMELAALFCAYGGYGLEIVDMNFDGILPAVQTGKCDFAAAGIGVTPERAESVLFSAPNFTGGTVAVVLRDDAGETAASGVRQDDGGEPAGESFLEQVKASFERTFIREKRWQLFAQGVLTTLLITALTILSGTLLGFGIFMLCRKGNPAANLVTRFCLWLVQGMPMVVLLMILYYVIFGSVAISGILVAVIGFTLTFGASVFGLLKMGVGAVDNGQYEAACALGYSDRRTFFKIILPQALPHVLPAYRGEIVGLIKATAIVGYIAVQDLTKMGDIVRSRTYEAFFPLIAVTVIYFVLEGLLGLLISRITVGFNPKRRKPAEILKGVKRDD